MQFQLLLDERTGEVSAVSILYTDESGAIWTVPEGHRFWALYEQWLSEGNMPATAS